MHTRRNGVSWSNRGATLAGALVVATRAEAQSTAPQSAEPTAPMLQSPPATDASPPPTLRPRGDDDRDWGIGTALGASFSGPSLGGRGPVNGVSFAMILPTLEARIFVRSGISIDLDAHSQQPHRVVCGAWLRRYPGCLPELQPWQRWGPPARGPGARTC